MKAVVNGGWEDSSRSGVFCVEHCMSKPSTAWHHRLPEQCFRRWSSQRWSWQRMRLLAVERRWADGLRNTQCSTTSRVFYDNPLDTSSHVYCILIYPLFEYDFKYFVFLFLFYFPDMSEIEVKLMIRLNNWFSIRYTISWKRHYMMNWFFLFDVVQQYFLFSNPCQLCLKEKTKISKSVLEYYLGHFKNKINLKSTFFINRALFINLLYMLWHL